MDGDGAADAPWHFGTATQYPALSLDADGDGQATWEELGHQLRAGPAVTAATGVHPAQVALTWTAVGAGAWTPSPAVTYTVYRESGRGWWRQPRRRSGVRSTRTAGVEPGGAYT